MATIRRMFSCKNSQCKGENGKHRGYKKVQVPGEVKALCKHCGVLMVLSENYITRQQVNGEVRTKTLTGDAEFAADYLAECRTAARTGNLLPGSEPMISWKEATERFNDWLDRGGNKKKKLSPKTVLFYRDMLKPLEVPFKCKKYGTVNFTRMNLQDVEKGHVEAFKVERSKLCLPATVNGSLAILKRMYSVVCDEEKAGRTPRLHEAMADIFKVELDAADNQVETILENEEEWSALLGFCKSPQLYHFTYGALSTGLRHQDMLQLRIEEINLAKNEITTVVKGGTKVTIPLTPGYRDYLESWLSRGGVRRISGCLIPSTGGKNPARKGKPYANAEGIGFTAACEKAADHFDKLGNRDAAERFRALTPHCLRHTFATHFLYKASKELGATAAVHVLSKILGHSSTYITERYSHALKDVQQSAMASFGAQMFTSVTVSVTGA